MSPELRREPPLHHRAFGSKAHKPVFQSEPPDPRTRRGRPHAAWRSTLPRGGGLSPSHRVPTRRESIAPRLPCLRLTLVALLLTVIEWASARPLKAERRIAPSDTGGGPSPHLSLP